jgi:phosphoglycolate phosphatase-like HAD superfamily hydrolase
MIKRAKNDLNIDIGRSYLIGDSTIDLETARNAGLVSIGLKCGYGCKDNKFNINPDYWADDLYHAVELIKLLEKNY